MKSCKARYLKYFVHYSNLLLMLTGFVLIGIGAVGIVGDSPDTLAPFGVAGIQEVFIGTFILGILISIISFLIFCGAVVEHRRTIQAYLCVMGALIVVTLAMSITSLVVGSNNEEILERIMRHEMQAYDTNARARSTWDIVQRNGYCCGIHGFKDWKTERLPNSCYFLFESTSITENGCLKSRYTEKYALKVFGIAGISFCFLDSVMLVVVVYLMTILKRERALSVYNSMESL